jgi:hypothetical protein
LIKNTKEYHMIRPVSSMNLSNSQAPSFEEQAEPDPSQGPNQAAFQSQIAEIFKQLANIMNMLSGSGKQNGGDAKSDGVGGSNPVGGACGAQKNAPGGAADAPTSPPSSPSQPSPPTASRSQPSPSSPSGESAGGKPTSSNDNTNESSGKPGAANTPDAPAHSSQGSDSGNNAAPPKAPQAGDAPQQGTQQGRPRSSNGDASSGAAADASGGAPSSSGRSAGGGAAADSKIDAQTGQLSLRQSTNDVSQYYQGGDNSQKDKWGSSNNVDKPAVFNAVYNGVKDNWDNGKIPDNVKEFFSSAQSDKHFSGLNLSSDPTTKAQQKTAVWQLGIADHETGSNFDPGKLPSYYKAGGDGSGAGETQQAGMRADPDGMTYGMFSTQSNKPIDVSDPGQAVVADLQKFGFNLNQKNGNVGQVLQMISQTDSTSVLPTIQSKGNDFLAAFE